MFLIIFFYKNIVFVMLFLYNTIRYKIGDAMNKKGFTLVEVLATITILSVLMTIAVVSVSFIMKKSRDRAYIQIRESVETATYNYMVKNGKQDSVKIKELVDDGYLEAPIDPVSKEACVYGTTSKVVIYKNDPDGDYYVDNGKEYYYLINRLLCGKVNIMDATRESEGTVPVKRIEVTPPLNNPAYLGVGAVMVYYKIKPLNATNKNVNCSFTNGDIVKLKTTSSTSIRLDPIGVGDTELTIETEEGGYHRTVPISIRYACNILSMSSTMSPNSENISLNYRTGCQSQAKNITVEYKFDDTEYIKMEGGSIEFPPERQHQCVTLKLSYHYIKGDYSTEKSIKLVDNEEC